MAAGLRQPWDLATQPDQFNACNVTGPEPPAAGAAPGPGTQLQAPDSSPNVIVFDPSMPTSEIEATANSLWLQQRDAEMGSDRYSLLFKPGEYGTDADPLQIAVGYYTEVAGLGASPDDVQINGKVRGRIDVAADASADVIEAAALADDKIAAIVDGATPKKVIVVPGRMVYIVL